MILAPLIGMLALLAPPEIPDEMRGDADLTDVCFVDADLGFAVGDRGLILRTNDGGRSWRRLDAGVVCPLQAVHFIDAKRGWAVGGWTQAKTLRTFGVVLRTTDGGDSWEESRDFHLPKLSDVQFADAKNGWVVGVGSALFPAGVFRTRDGGASWSSLGGAAADWLAADFSAGAAVVAGRNGSFATIDGPQVRPHRIPPTSKGRRISLRDVAISNRTVWAVGDGGAILATTDQARSWRRPADVIPTEITRLFDFASISVIGEKVWVVGSPGSRILHSPDGGVHWRLQTTDNSLPLHSVTFIDANRGWAVGALGVVHSTRDGGATWRTLRGQQRRAAFAVSSPRVDLLPMEFLARFAGNDGYFGVAQSVFETPEVNPVFTARSDRAAEGVALLGASFERAAPFFSAPELLQLPESELATYAGGEAAIEERLACFYRQWRPSVVVLSGDEEDSHSRLANRLALSAIEKAADEEAYPAMSGSLGLPAWRVEKVYRQTTDDRRGDVQLTPAEILPRYGIALGDAAARARDLTAPRSEAPTGQQRYQLASSRLITTTLRRDAFSGLDLPAGGSARRQEGRTLAANLSALRQLANKRRNAEALLEYAGGSGAIIAELGALSHGLPAEAAGNLLLDLADDYFRQGKVELALDVRQLFLTQFPGHPRADALRIWMIQYGSSGEAWLLTQQRLSPKNSTNIARRNGAGVAPAQAIEIVDSDESPRENGVKLIEAVNNRQSATGVPSVGAAPAAAISLANNTLRKTAVRFGEGFSRTNLVLRSRGEIMLPLAASLRQLDRNDEAEKLLRRMGAGDPSQVSTRMAWAENWVANPRDHARPAVAVCKKADDRPVLDGRFDDACWKEAQPISLATPSGRPTDWPAAMMTAYDTEFLYVAISCRKASRTKYSETLSKRTRDPEMKSHDRLVWSLDIDRDYTTYWDLTFDQRGAVSESFFGDPSWNPRLFVASQDGGEYWAIEAAIPFEELAGAAPSNGATWAMKSRRIAPGSGAQEWQYPGGLLKFE